MKDIQETITAHLSSIKPNQTKLMTHTHTHSPWRVESWTYRNAREVLTIQTDKDAIAQMCELWRDGNESSCEVTANARLIAAAPELLEALQMLMPQEPNEADSYDAATWRNARNAIDNATGRAKA